MRRKYENLLTIYGKICSSRHDPSVKETLTLVPTFFGPECTDFKPPTQDC